MTHQAIRAAYRPDLSIFDKSNPCSLINKVPATLVPWVEKLVDNEQLFARLIQPDISVRKYAKPDERDERIKLLFWDEYNRATACDERMVLDNIIRSVCPYEVWQAYYGRNLDTKFLWILVPPRDYKQSLRRIHARAMERLGEIMDLPFYDRKTKKVDTKTASLVLKAFQLVDLRLQGSVLQRFQIQQQTLNVDVSAEQMANLSQLSVEELEALDKKMEIEERKHRELMRIPATLEEDTMRIDIRTPTQSGVRPYTDPVDTEEKKLLHDPDTQLLANETPLLKE